MRLTIGPVVKRIKMGRYGENMSSNRVIELVQKLTQLDAERDAVRAELGSLLGFNAGAVVAVPAAVPAKPKAPPKPRESGENGGRKQPTMKQLVQNILAKHPEGLNLTGISTPVAEMVERGEYSTKSGNITALVGQAINQLQSEKLIVGEKSPETKRNLYRLTTSAA
jgi:hypothetical protein